MASRTRPYGGAADLPRMIDLFVAARDGGPYDIAATAIELRLLLCSPSFNPAMHTCLWEDESGALTACGLMWDGSPTLVYALRPRPRDGDLLEQVIAWATDCVREMGRTVGERLGLIVRPRDDDLGAIALLESLGFARRDWHTLRMLRPLHELIPAPQLPAGFTPRHVRGEDEAEEYVALHRAAFGMESMTLARRLAWMRDPAYLPALDLVAVAPDGALAAFCACSISHEENARRRHAEGWIDFIGTHPAFQRRGLARALLLTGLQRLKEHGVETAILGTGSENEARRVYEAAGFRTAYTILVYGKEI